MIEILNHYTENYNHTIWYAISYEFKIKNSIYKLWPDEIKTFIKVKNIEKNGINYSPFEIDYDLEIKLYKQDYISLTEMVNAYEETAFTEIGRS
jgi:hypothetical protein